MLGKKTARLDLGIDADRERFTEPLSGADVLVHGYRTDVLDNLGFGQDVRTDIRPRPCRCCPQRLWVDRSVESATWLRQPRADELWDR